MLDVICNPDGTLLVRCDADTAATLGGRPQFGDIGAIQDQLKEAVADAWYGAGCPRER